MKRRSFIITGISLAVLAISPCRLETVRSQDVSGASTNAIAVPSPNLNTDGEGPDLAAAMIVWLPLDDGHGTQALDASGHGHDGTLIGNPLPVWILGVSSNALQFDGIQNEVKVADDPSLTPTNALTVVAWVKASPTTTGLILDKWSTDGSSGSYSLSLTV